MFANIRSLIENTPWIMAMPEGIMAMPEGTGTFAVWAHNRFLAYYRPNFFCKWGSPNSHKFTVVVFYAIVILFTL